MRARWHPASAAHIPKSSNAVASILNSCMLPQLSQTMSLLLFMASLQNQQLEADVSSAAAPPPTSRVMAADEAQARRPCFEGRGRGRGRTCARARGPELLGRSTRPRGASAVLEGGLATVCEGRSAKATALKQENSLLMAFKWVAWEHITARGRQAPRRRTHLLATSRGGPLAVRFHSGAAKLQVNEHRLRIALMLAAAASLNPGEARTRGRLQLPGSRARARRRLQGVLSKLSAHRRRCHTTTYYTTQRAISMVCIGPQTRDLLQNGGRLACCAHTATRSRDVPSRAASAAEAVSQRRALARPTWRARALAIPQSLARATSAARLPPVRPSASPR